MSKYQQQIETIVSQHGTITINDLSKLLDVSNQTIRRIVKPLVKSGKIKKVHGAIVSAENPMDAPFLTRMQHMRPQKLAIAAAVYELVKDGDVLAIDSGSTSGFVAQALRARRGLTVVTNSAYVASTLAMTPGNRVFMAGTQLRDHDGAGFDRSAFQTIERLNANKCILSASSVDPKRGFLVREQCEMEIAVAMQTISDQCIIAVDHSKFEMSSKHSSIHLPLLHDTHTVITDTKPEAAFKSVLHSSNIILAEPV